MNKVALFSILVIQLHINVYAAKDKIKLPPILTDSKKIKTLMYTIMYGQFNLLVRFEKKKSIELLAWPYHNFKYCEEITTISQLFDELTHKKITISGATAEEFLRYQNNQDLCEVTNSFFQYIPHSTHIYNIASDQPSIRKKQEAIIYLSHQYEQVKKMHKTVNSPEFLFNQLVQTVIDNRKSLKNAINEQKLKETIFLSKNPRQLIQLPELQIIRRKNNVLKEIHLLAQDLDQKNPAYYLKLLGEKIANQRSTSSSPRFGSPRFGSPRFDSPRFDSPRFDSPRFDSPRFDSPRFDSPRSMNSSLQSSTDSSPRSTDSSPRSTDSSPRSTDSNPRLIGNTIRLSRSYEDNPRKNQPTDSQEDNPTSNLILRRIRSHTRSTINNSPSKRKLFYSISSGNLNLNNNL